MYQLIIHHDIGIINEGGALKKDDKSPGHVYLELKENTTAVLLDGYEVTGHLDEQHED